MEALIQSSDGFHRCDTPDNAAPDPYWTVRGDGDSRENRYT